MGPAVEESRASWRVRGRNRTRWAVKVLLACKRRALEGRYWDDVVSKQQVTRDGFQVWPGGCLQIFRVHQRKGPVLSGCVEAVWRRRRFVLVGGVKGWRGIPCQVGSTLPWEWVQESVVVAAEAEAGQCSRRCIHARFFLVGSSAPHDLYCKCASMGCRLAGVLKRAGG